MKLGRYICGIVLIIASINTFGESLFTKDKKEFPLILFHKVMLGSCKQSKCMASKAILDAKFSKQLIIGPNGENPTSEMCRQLKGHPWFLYDQKRNQVSVCFFKDKSFFRSWDLFNKLFKIKR